MRERIAPAADSEPISFGRRLRELSALWPEEPALIYARSDGSTEQWTRRELESGSNRIARGLASRGVKPGSTVVIALSNCPEHALTALAAWKLGALALPLPNRAPPAERAGLLEMANPAAIVAEWEPDRHATTIDRAGLAAMLVRESAEPLEDRISHPGKAIASGGSTGRPKIIVDPAPWARRPGELVELFGVLGFRSRQRHLLGGPLYHNAPFLWLHYCLFEEGSVVLMERFDAPQAVDLIERWRVEWILAVPTMMGRIARLPNVGRRDLSSLEAIYHTAAPCPAWVKRAWIELIGAERVFEAYGSTENVGAAIIRGDEWLAHPGSVGRPRGCEIRILDPLGRPLPAGRVGEVFSRPLAGRQFEYRGEAAIRTAGEGFQSVGDLGWVDDDGYLYLADRRTDLIITGGVNVYPAEVEAVLTEHPAVEDAAVIGLPDPDLGKRVHGVVELRQDAAAVSNDELLAHCRGRLSPAKVPKAVEVVSQLPRTEAGKIRREELVRERTHSNPEARSALA